MLAYTGVYNTRLGSCSFQQKLTLALQQFVSRQSQQQINLLAESINLERTFNIGYRAMIRLEQAVCNRAELEQAVCNRAELEQAVCNRAELEQTVCNRAELERAVCNKAELEQAVCNRAE